MHQHLTALTRQPMWDKETPSHRQQPVFLCSALELGQLQAHWTQPTLNHCICIWIFINFDMLDGAHVIQPGPWYLQMVWDIHLPFSWTTSWSSRHTHTQKLFPTVWQAMVCCSPAVASASRGHPLTHQGPADGPPTMQQQPSPMLCSGIPSPRPCDVLLQYYTNLGQSKWPWISLTDHVIEE